MSEPQTTGAESGMSGEEMFSALFAQMVMRQANMALMLMGKVAHPESGETIKDIDSARLFIDELEMLEAKTKGNLNKEEAGLLKQTLMSVRLAFVDAVETPAPAQAEPKAPTPATPAAAGAEPSQPAASPEESHKKFSKKY